MTKFDAVLIFCSCFRSSRAFSARVVVLPRAPAIISFLESGADRTGRSHHNVGFANGVRGNWTKVPRYFDVPLLGDRRPIRLHVRIVSERQIISVVSHPSSALRRR